MNMRIYIALITIFASSLLQAEQQTIQIGQATRMEINVPLTALELIAAPQQTVTLESRSLTDIRIRERGAVLVVESGQSPPVSLRMSIPDHLDLRVNAARADVAISGLKASLTVRNENNRVVITDITGNVNASSQLGEVVISDVTGDVDAETNNQNVTLTGIQGNVRARSTTNAVLLKDSRVTRAELHSVTSAVRYEGPLPQSMELIMGSHSGEVSLTIPEDSHASIEFYGNTDAVSVSGAEWQMLDEQRGQLLLGNGRARVEMESIRGALRVELDD